MSPPTTPPGRSDAKRSKPLLRVLAGETRVPPPIWLMRQAGRYLPEYRALRERSGGFIELCMTPELAAEATLQPVRRFGLDAAILFSDILVVPHGLGQAVAFEESRGPVLVPLKGPDDVRELSLDRVVPALSAVYEAVRLIVERLPAEVTLIGFAGAPWTVASYMVEGGTSRDFERVKQWAYGDPGSFSKLIDIVTLATIEHLMAQIDAGAEAVQLFDSWAGVLPEPELKQWSLGPIRRIVDALRERRPHVPVIVFPRGVGILYTDYATLGASAVSLDTMVPLDFAARELQRQCVVQGNLDPVTLVVGGKALERSTRLILDKLAKGRFVFNLGHGVLPTTPPAHVEDLVRIVRSHDESVVRSWIAS